MSLTPSRQPSAIKKRIARATGTALKSPASPRPSTTSPITPTPAITENESSSAGFSNETFKSLAHARPAQKANPVSASARYRSNKRSMNVIALLESSPFCAMLRCA